MAGKTVHDRLVAALQRRGETLVADARSTRYTVLTRSRGNGGYYYIGKAGALRAGPTVARSRPLAAAFRAQLLAEADEPGRLR